jgi:endonuclease/exonuclease/phosphatase family metal-dependent hydrolase
MRVMTFNILHGTARKPPGGWSVRRKLVADVIGRWDPDVAGLQEAMAHQLLDLAGDLPEYGILEGPVSGRNRLRSLASRNTDHGEHCAILYRKDRFRVCASGAFWLSERPEEPGSLLRGTWQPRVVHWARLEEMRGHGTVTIYNAHMDYLPWAPRRSGRILRERLERDWDGTPQFLIGDLNAPTQSVAIRGLLQNGLRDPRTPPLRDAWAEAARREGPAETLHRGTGRGSWPGRIDHILFRARMLVESLCTVTHCAGGLYPSDHFPVVAQMRSVE